MSRCELRNQDAMRARPNIEKSISSINASTDIAWLRDFHRRMTLAGEKEIIKAIDLRLKELDELNFRKQIPVLEFDLDLVHRVTESLTAYEMLRTREQGKTF